MEDKEIQEQLQDGKVNIITPPLPDFMYASTMRDIITQQQKDIFMLRQQNAEIHTRVRNQYEEEIRFLKRRIFELEQED